MSDDWYRRDPRKAINGMIRLTLEERGAYGTIIDHQYLMGRPLPDDDAYLAGIMGCDIRVWRRVKAQLVAKGRIVISDGFVADLRASYTLAERQANRNAKAMAGSKGGIASGKARKTNDLSEAGASTETKQIREEEKREESPLPPKGQEAAGKMNGEHRPPPVPDETIQAFARFKASYPKRKGPQDWKTAEERFGRAVKAGIAPETILAGLIGYVRGLEETGRIGTEYVRQAAVFLSKETWREYADSGAASGPIETDDDVWTRRLEYGRTERKWSLESWGPLPGELGSLVPAHLLKPGDGEGWQLRQAKR